MKNIYNYSYLLIAFLMICNQNIISQETQAFLKLDYSNRLVVDSWNRNDDNLCFWHENQIGTFIQLKHFDLTTLPTEIYTHTNEVNQQVDASIADWNSPNCIDMAYDDEYDKAIPLKFVTDPSYFFNDPNILAHTRFAVLKDQFTGKHYLQHWSGESQSIWDQTQVSLRDSPEWPYEWTTEQEYVDDETIPFKYAILHELGHVIGLGHSTYEYNEAIMSVEVYLEEDMLFELTELDEEGVETYCIFQGMNAAIEIKARLLNRFLSHQHSFFDYSPDILFYSQNKTKRDEDNSETWSEKNLFTEPENNKHEGVKK